MSNFNDVYVRLAHAIQSGIAHLMNNSPSLTDPKHMRVGVNLRAIETGAMAKLLVEKGVFTQEEWEGALITGMEEEVTRYEAEISKALGGGVEIKLA